jgi:tRNA A37 threonylcarbamoyltransferase TsaD
MKRRFQSLLFKLNLCRYATPIVPVHHMEAHALVARLSGGTDVGLYTLNPVDP